MSNIKNAINLYNQLHFRIESMHLQHKTIKIITKGDGSYWLCSDKNDTDGDLDGYDIIKFALDKSNNSVRNKQYDFLVAFLIVTKLILTSKNYIYVLTKSERLKNYLLLNNKDELSNILYYINRNKEKIVNLL